MKNKTFYSLLGFCAGFAPIIIIFLWKAYRIQQAWWEQWARMELMGNKETYIVLIFISVTILTTLGYLLGKAQDAHIIDAQQQKDTNLALSHMAITDGLTGLFNARHIHDQINIELQNSFRSSMSCLLIDIDHFKKLNDTYGHPFGDAVLIQLAKILKHNVRKIDSVGRLGGEEFIVILPQIGSEMANQIAMRILGAVSSQTFSNDQTSNIHVTVSIGLVSKSPTKKMTPKTLLQAADSALYTAKNEGRNRIIEWEEKIK